MDGLVEVWLVRVDVPGQLLACLAGLLDEGERDRAASMISPLDRRRFVVAHGATRLIIGRAMSVPPASLRFAHGPHGKPELAGGDGGRLCFSLSHSGEYATVALSRGRPVGVDIEQGRPGADVVAISNRFYPPAEAAFVRAAPDPAVASRRFTRLWARKEACVKVAGGRLAPGLRTPVQGAAPLVVATAAGEPPGRLLVRDVPAPAGFCAAVAVAGAWPCGLARHWWRPPPT